MTCNPTLIAQSESLSSLIISKLRWMLKVRVNKTYDPVEAIKDLQKALFGDQARL